MCGLVGMMTSALATDKQLDLLAGLLYVDQVRGRHATGIAKINPWSGDISIHKRAMAAQQFLGLEETQEFLEKQRGRIYLGHNRYATLGDKSKHENAHPFQDEHITLVHNGGVDSWAMDKLEGNDDDEVVVDSHMVCKTIAKHGIEEAVKKFSGAFALIWWDDKEKTINFIRNKERPLWLAELTDNTLVWASEKQFLDFFVTREKNGYKYKTEPKELPVDLHIYWQFNDKGVLTDPKPKSRELKFTRMPDPNPRQSYYDMDYYRGGKGNKTYGNYYNSSANYDKRANDLMKYHKINAHVGARITFKVREIEQHTSNPLRVNIVGEYDGVDVVIYFMEKAVYGEAKYISAVVTNCHERRVTYQGTTWQEPTLSCRADGARVEQAKLSVITNTTPTVIGNNFPLKVHGHTFQTRTEFVDFVGKGCEMCGKVPLACDSRNPEMSVYAQPHFNGLLKDCDYICGECCVETETK